MNQRDEPTERRSQDDAFLAQLREPPRPEFAAALYERLMRQEPSTARGLEAGRARGFFAARPRALMAAGIVLLLSATLALPTVARTLLPHVAPREVASLPTPALTMPSVASPDRGREAPTGAPDQVELVPLVPAYLPPGCVALEHTGQTNRQAVTLLYSCLTIAEQVAVDEQPRVAPGSTETVSVGDQSAVYVHGSWVGAPPAPGAPGGMVWREDAAQQLILERDGLIIHLITHGPTALAKDELIRIAASLHPAE